MCACRDSTRDPAETDIPRWKGTAVLVRGLPGNQLAKVEEMVADATAKGGTVATGGKRSELGLSFYEPTVITRTCESPVALTPWLDSQRWHMNVARSHPVFVESSSYKPFDWSTLDRPGSPMPRGDAGRPSAPSTSKRSSVVSSASSAKNLIRTNLRSLL